MDDSRVTKRLILFSSLVRWAFGVLFISVGAAYYKEGAWPAILFGLLFFITGFFRPRRCLKERC